MNYLSISSIVRNEHLYLYEWVEHHLAEGIDHFYLYDNSVPGEPDQKEVVSEYAEYITWHDLKGIAMQRASADHTINTYKNETKLCLFCDVDEFFYSPNDTSILDTLSGYFSTEVGGLAVHWLLFGSNGHETYSPEDVRERFTKRAEGVNPHVKSIMDLSKTVCMGSNVHTFRANGDIIDENYQLLPLEYALSSPATADVFAINHYVTKSKEGCALRRGMARADTGEYRSDDFFLVHDCNEVEDRRILEI